MLSSWQVAQIHGQQSQQFGQSQAYSQQLSSMMPSPYQGVGLGAQGFQSGFQGGSYNYGAQGGGYGVGNSFGNRMTSMVGGSMQAMGPMPMGLAGAGIGGMMGGIPGALIGGAVGGVVGGAIRHIGNSFMEGAHEQSQMESTLSQFQFSNGSSRTGRGFTRQDSMQIGNMVRQMERMPEMLTSFGELNGLMNKMGQMGLMQGVKDAGEFSKKFKETISTLKDMAKVMGGSMESALQTFQEARMSGFYSQTDIVKNSLNRQVTAGLTGMNQGQIGALQQHGGEMGHATGGSRRSGARAITRTASQLGAANQMGILTNDQIMEMTGKEGAEGIQDLSVEMNQLAYRMGNSNVGQALTLALGAQKDGRYTGEMDQELVEKVRRGELSLSELKGLARSKAGTRGAKLSFAAHKNRLRSEMSGAVGAEGIGMQLQEILGSRGWSNPDAQNLVMQRFGASEEQANLLQQMMPNLQSMGSQISIAGRSEQRGAAINAVNKEHGWDAIKHRITKKLEHYTTDWAKDLGVKVRDYFQNWADDFLDDVSGEYRTNVTKRAADVLIGGGRKNALAGAMSRVGNIGGGDFSVGSSGGVSGLLARAAHWASGDESKGERALDVMRGAGMGSSLVTMESFAGDPMSEVRAAAMMKKGYTRLDSDHYVMADKLKEAQKRMSSPAFGRVAENLLKKNLGNDDQQLLVKAYQDAMLDAETSQESDPKKRAAMIAQKLHAAYDGAHGDGGGVLGSLMGATSKLPGMGASKDIRSRLSQTESAMALMKKTGLTDDQIIAGVQQMGGKFRGSVDFNNLATGSLSGFAGNSRAIAGALKDTEKDLAGAFKGDDKSSSWAEIKSLLDGGGDMATLFAGKDGKGGLMRDRDLQLLMQKDPSEWKPEDRKKLESMGIDPTKLASKLSTPEGHAQIDKLQNAARKGKGSAADIQKYLDLGLMQADVVTNNRFAERGAAASKRFTDAGSDKERNLLLQSGAKGGKVMSLLMGNSSGDLNSDNTADLVAAMNDLGSGSKEQRAARKLAGDEVNQVFDFDQATRKKLKGGSDAKGIAGQVGQGDNKELIDEIQSMLGKDGKLGGKGGEGELANIMKLLDDRISKGITTKPGAEVNSATASEQEIASSIKALSDNNVKMATILGNVATGKPPGEGLSSGPGGKT